MKPALRILARPSPRIFLSRSESSSLESLEQAIQGGRMYRVQNLQKLTIASLVIPRVRSALARVQEEQMLPIVGEN